MDKIRLENVRCIADTDWVPIRPLTLVLGRNSSGKSSFVRWLPLLKQSWSAPGTAPIVWTAQGGVDFGSYSEALRDDARPAEIRYGFQIEHRSGVAEFRVSLIKSENSTEVRRIEVNLPHRVKFEIDFPQGDDRASVKLNGRPSSEFAPTWSWFRRGKGPLQRVQAFQDDNAKEAETYPAEQRLVAALTRQKRGKMDPWRLSRLASDVDWVNENLQEALARHGAGTPTWKSNIRSFSQNSPIFSELLELYAIGEMDTLLDDLYRVMEESLRRLTYVAPFRAEPERDRRNPEPSATLDSRGSALIPFLTALPARRFKSLSDFVSDALGLGLELKHSGPMVELHVSERGLPRRNIADVGFGVGQVLPVLVHLWHHTTQERVGRVGRDQAKRAMKFQLIEPQIIVAPLVIEQPELHLHPAHQFSLGTAFANIAAKHTDHNARIIVETHSQELLNAVGEAVEKQVIPRKDVAIVLFDRGHESVDATVRLAEFDEKGYLQGDWPYGFFQPRSG